VVEKWSADSSSLSFLNENEKALFLESKSQPMSVITPSKRPENRIIPGFASDVGFLDEEIKAFLSCQLPVVLPCNEIYLMTD